MAPRNEDVGHAPTPQSIPLRDLSRPPDSQDITEEGRLAGSEDRHVRPSTRSRTSIGGSLRASGRYSRLAEDSPSPAERVRRPSQLHPLRIPGTTHASGADEEDVNVSPLVNREGFQEALGFAGLTIQEEAPAPSDSILRTVGSDVFRPGARQLSQVSPCSTPARRASDEFQEAPRFLETDTVPLTDTPRARTSRIRWSKTLRTPEAERTSFQSIRLSDQGSPVRRLGDDLWATDAEHGRARERSASVGMRKGSLSPSSAGSPLYRAGSMMRKMSQRVVNLSNEPEVVEQSIRKSSFAEEERRKDSHAVPPPTESPVGELDFIPSPVEKAPQLGFTGMRQNKWQQQVNPLKGKALGIFPGNNALRKTLCDVLVHP